VEPVENPYASPRSVEFRSDAETLLRATTKLYARMGWAGVAYTTIVYPIGMVLELSERPVQLGPTMGGTIMCGLMLGFFVIRIKTAKDLATDLDRTYRRARWTAILAAAIFFPILTFPAVLAVRRLERYRRFMAGQIVE
jgi:hypothetical protein